MTEKHVVISMDSHVELYVDTKAYLASQWHDIFDYNTALARQRFEDTRRWRPQLGDAPRMSGRTGETHYYTDARPLEQRLKELDEDGIAGEFITVGFGPRSTDPEFMHACTQAEMRWFQDFFSPAAFRFRGAVVVNLQLGMQGVIQEIAEARERGIMAVILAGNPANAAEHLPTYNSRYYDPMWSALSERNMVVVFHPGWSREKALVEFAGTDYEPGWEALNALRMGADTAASLPQLLLGAVPQRFPNLRFGLVEAHAAWIPETLQRLDGSVKGVGKSSIKYEMLPSEMWSRQFFASGPLEKEDVAARHEVGIDNLAWGSDYPHSEGTWPISRNWLAYLFRDVPDDETEKLVCANAARIFDFDLDKLGETPAADMPWPSREEASRWHDDDTEDPFFRVLVDD